MQEISVVKETVSQIREKWLKGELGRKSDKKLPDPEVLIKAKLRVIEDYEKHQLF